MNFFDVKNELPDNDDSEDPEFNVQCFDTIEIEKEFKTENLTHYLRPDDNRSYLLKHCTTCNKSWKPSAKLRQKSCAECQTNFWFKCRKCTKVFQTCSGLLKHLNNNCNIKPRFYCDHCNHKAHFKYKLAEHIQGKHKLFKNLNSCTRCEKNFSYPQGLMSHIKTCGQDIVKLIGSKRRSTKPVKHLSCDHCNFKFDRKQYLESHIHSKHFPDGRILNKCDKCEKSYSDKSNFLRHLKICSNGSVHRFVCDVCYYKTHYKQHFLRHKKFKHYWDEKVQKPIPLSVIQKSKNQYNFKIKKYRNQNTFRIKKYKNQHRLIPRINYETYFCDHCPHKATTKGNLADHIYAVHFRDPNVNKCKKCKKTFSQKGYFRRHTIVCGHPKDSRHLLGLRRYCCDHCDFKTILRSSIVTHLQCQHSFRDPNKNKCDKCNKSHINLSRLTRHLKICVKSKNSKRSSFILHCDHCGYKCRKKKEIVRHIQLEHLTEVVLLTNVMMQHKIEPSVNNNLFMLDSSLMEIIVRSENLEN